MSISALDWAGLLPLKGPKKAVLLALARHADENGKCYPSEARLMLWAGVEERTLRYALRELQEAKAITVACSRGGRRASEYTLNLDLVTPVVPPGSASATRKRRGNGLAEGHHMPPTAPGRGHQMPLKTALGGHDMPRNGHSGAPDAPHVEIRGAPDAPEGGTRCPSAGHQMPPKGHRRVIEGEEARERATASRRAAPTPLPKDWQPDAEEEGYAADLGLSVAVVAARFAAWHRRKATRSPDWKAEWQWWCLNQVERDEQADTRGNGMVKVIASEGWVSRRNGHDRDVDAGVKVIQGIFGNA